MKPERLASSIVGIHGDLLPVVDGTGTRINATAAAVSTAAAAVPAGGNLLIVRATDAIWLRFGAAGVGAAAADLNSILFVGGEGYYHLKEGDTHFRVLRVGAADVIVQLESVATQ